jgi:hypothetical protein
VVVEAALVSTVVVDSMIIILMGMDLHPEDLEDQVASMALQAETLGVRVVAQATARQVEGMQVAGVGIAETSSVKVLVGTKTGIQSGLDISRQPVTLITVACVPKYVAPYYGELACKF